MQPILYIIIPCYNEEKVLPTIGPLFCQKLDSLIVRGKVNSKSRILFVNDGSSDSTWDLIRGMADKSRLVLGGIPEQK